MAVEVSRQHVEQILQGMTIPPRPALLDEVDRELARDDANLQRVAAIIARDVSLSAAVMKTLNSPMFALCGKLSSIGQAIGFLGVRNVRNIVTGLVLRNAMKDRAAALSLERFWDSAEKVASISAFICTRAPRAPRDQAYVLGLFRDCGIPLLMQRFPDYRETLRQAAAESRSLPDIEQVRYGTSHTAVGSIVARSWGLPEGISHAILNHHRPAIVAAAAGPDPAVKALVATNYLAEHIFESVVQKRNDPCWESCAGPVLDFLALSDEQYYEIEDHAAGLGR